MELMSFCPCGASMTLPMSLCPCRRCHRERSVAISSRPALKVTPVVKDMRVPLWGEHDIANEPLSVPALSSRAQRGDLIKTCARGHACGQDRALCVPPAIMPPGTTSEQGNEAISASW